MMRWCHAISGGGHHCFGNFLVLLEDHGDGPIILLGVLFAVRPSAVRTHGYVYW
jgi:hypothetical protein